MKYRLPSKLMIGLVFLLSSCFLIQIPFQLLNSVLKLGTGLIKGLLSVGSAAAVQAAKFSPYALLFTGAAPPPTPQEPIALLAQAGGPPPARGQVMEKIATAFSNAPLEIVPLSEAMKDMGQEKLSSGNAILFHPSDLLLPSTRQEIVACLGNRRIVQTRWVYVEADAQVGLQQ